MFIVQYIVVTVTIIYVVLFAYIKICYPFWNNQPVYHTYDIWRWVCSEPFFIYKYRPVKTKFYSPMKVTTVLYLEATAEQKSEVLLLLLSNYISNDRILLTLEQKNMDALYAGHSDTPYISFYSDKNWKVEEVNDPNSDIVQHLRILGSIFSYPVKIYYAGSPPRNTYTELPLYFMDYLCVYRELDKHRKNKVVRELFQTHEYNQRTYNPTIAGSLFKREIDLLEGVVPLVQYTTYIYYLRNLTFPPLPAHFEVVQIVPETMDLLTEFMFVQTHLDLEKTPHHLDLLSVTSLGNYVETIRQNMTYVFCLKRGEHVYATYFFRDAKTQYEDLEGNTLQFYGSICNTETAHLFYLGFLHSIYLIVKKHKEFKMMMFENLGDNTTLHTMWRNKNSPTLENKTAYYTFNWIRPGSPLRPEKCLFL